MGIAFEELPGWTFEVEEVSAGVYMVTGRSSTGNRVEITTTNPDDGISEARDAAKHVDTNRGNATPSSSSKEAPQ